MKMSRESWETVWFEMLDSTAKRSSCLSRSAAALLISKDKRVVSQGYNGAPKGVEDCIQRGKCWRAGEPSGSNLHWCIGTHAEINAIINANVHGVPTRGTLMIINCQPCLDCLKAIVNAEIAEVWYTSKYDLDPALKPQWEKIVKESKIILEYMPRSED